MRNKNWIAEKSDKGELQHFIIYDDRPGLRPLVVLDTFLCDPALSIDEQEAIATLAAAAPLMMETLMDAADAILRGDDVDIGQIMDTIARATVQP